MQDTEIDRPAPGGAALLIIDMINDMAFEGAQALRREAGRAAHAILRLRDEADRLGVPVIYVNDNFGQWHSDRERIVEHCERNGSAAAREVVRTLAPRKNDFFVIKPQFSGFYATNLPVLLPRLKVSRLVLTGVATDACVLFTAADAHMREYDLWVPSDAVASDSEERARCALEIMENSMGADTRGAGALSLANWVETPAGPP